MPRTNYVKAARARQDGRTRTCYACGEPIQVGQPYKWFKIKRARGGTRRDYHEGCQIRPWDKTASPYRQHVLHTQFDAEQALSTEGLALADIAQVVRDYAESMREMGEMYQESASNMEEGFGHETYQSQELAEKAEACESFADECDGTADDIETLDDPDEDLEVGQTDYEGELNEDGEPVDRDEWESYLDDLRDQRRQEAMEMAQEAVSGEPEA